MYCSILLSVFQCRCRFAFTHTHNVISRISYLHYVYHTFSLALALTNPIHQTNPNRMFLTLSNNGWMDGWMVCTLYTHTQREQNHSHCCSCCCCCRCFAHSNSDAGIGALNAELVSRVPKGIKAMAWHKSKPSRKVKEGKNAKKKRNTCIHTCYKRGAYYKYNAKWKRQKYFEIYTRTHTHTRTDWLDSIFICISA